MNINSQQKIIKLKDEIFNLNILLDYKYCNYDDIDTLSYLDKEKIRISWNYDFINIETRNNIYNLNKILNLLSFKNINCIEELYKIQKIENLISNKKEIDIDYYFNFKIKTEKNCTELALTFGNKSYNLNYNDENLISINIDHYNQDLDLMVKKYKLSLKKNISIFLNVDENKITEEHFNILKILII